MNYVKYFRDISFDEVEKTLNKFLADIARKDHRVMSVKFRLDLNAVSAIYTINDEPRRPKK